MCRACIAQFLFLSMSVAISAEQIVVDLNGGGDYTRIQEALDAASDGATVLVAPGTHTITESIVFDRFHDPQNPGGPPARDITLRSTAGPHETTICMKGPDSSRRTVVVFEHGESEETVLDGFTITSGRWNPDSPGGTADLYGAGGIICRGARCNPTITNCIVTANEGGGIYCHGRLATETLHVGNAPTISNCVFTGNTQWGVCFDLHSSATLLNCTVSENPGVGIHCNIGLEAGNPSIIGCTITNNGGNGIAQNGYRDGSRVVVKDSTIAGNEACGVFVKAGTLLIENCSVIGNKEIGIGGTNCAGPDGRRIDILGCRIDDNRSSGVWLNLSRATLRNSSIRNNSTSGNGGGFCGYWEEDTLIENCVFSANRARLKGGGIFSLANSDRVTVRYVHCTIIGNESETSGGGLHDGGGAPKSLTNSIVWGNQAPRGAQISLGATTCELMASHSDIEGGESAISIEPAPFPDHPDTVLSKVVWLPSSISVDPRLSFASDFHLLADSPCIDSGGVDTTGTLPAEDIHGNPRKVDGNGDSAVEVDMGAHEYGGSGEAPLMALSKERLDFYTSVDGSGSGVQLLHIRNCGGGRLNWTLETDSPWLRIAPETGSVATEVAEIEIALEPHTLSCGNHTFRLTASDTGAVNNPEMIWGCVHVADNLSVPRDYATIQSAIDAAGDGSTIVVSDGTYKGAGNRSINFRGKMIALRSENGPESCVIDCERLGFGFDFIASEGRTSILDGFTILNGSHRMSFCGETCPGATGNDKGHGGGIRCLNSSPTIRNCWILDCVSVGIFGGGIYSGNGAPLIENCVIRGNRSARDGGGLHFNDSSEAVVSNCVIQNNRAPGQGGAIMVQNSGKLAVTIRNCLVTGNIAGTDGGGVLVASSTANISNCTLVENSAGSGGAVCIFADEKTPSLTNSILWGNEPDEILERSTGSIIVHNTIRGGHAGMGNRNADPLFCPGESGDFYLSQTAAGQNRDSPCVDAGRGNAVDLGLDRWTTRTDGAGDQGVVDMGYHYPIDSPEGPLFRRGDANSDSQLSITDAIYVLTYLFLTGSEPPCLDAADSDDNGRVNITDAVRILGYLFLSGDPLPDPSASCGSDPTEDVTGCASFSACSAVH